MVRRFALSFFLVFLVLGSVSTIYAANNATEEGKTVNYDLPYPGILPDSPLWLFKDLRDKVVGLFIFDPVVKGQYQMKLGDKKLAMAQILINNGQKELGEKVLTWAAGEYDRAIDKAEEAKLKNLKSDALRSQLSLFASKFSATPAFSKIINRVQNLFLENVTNP